MAMLDAFLDGATGAGLFRKLSWPGAPTELIDRGVADFDETVVPLLYADLLFHRNESGSETKMPLWRSWVLSR